jgi:ketosteroid isomerase-like protein
MDSTSALGSSDEVVAAWRAAGERGDAMAAAACMAPDVTVISPLTAQFRFHGRDQARDMLSAAFEVISDIRFHTETGDANTRALFYHAHAGNQALEEAQLLRLDAAGQIAELTLFGRPLPGLTAVMAQIGPRLLQRQNRSTLARVIALATAPLAAMTRLGERHLVPLADPGRPGRRN